MVVVKLTLKPFLSTNMGQFVQQELMLSCSFRCDMIHNCRSYDFGHTLLYCISLTWMFNKPTSEGGLLNERSCIAAALGVTKFTNARGMISVTLCCAT
jgi:hypothetical protein